MSKNSRLLRHLWRKWKRGAIWRAFDRKILSTPTPNLINYIHATDEQREEIGYWNSVMRLDRYEKE